MGQRNKVNSYDLRIDWGADIIKAFFAVLRVLASNTRYNHLEAFDDKLKAVFNDMDTDHDGFISLEELAKGLENNGIVVPGDESTLRRLFSMIDTSGDNQLSIEEFTNVNQK